MKNSLGSRLHPLSSSRSGQVIIVMLGIMSFALVIGLAISSRIVTGLRQATYSTQSAQALSFAEAGAEHALRCIGRGEISGNHCTGDSGGLDVGGDSDTDVNYTIDPLSSTVYSDTITRDDTVQVNLSSFSGSQIRIYWASGTDEINNPKAIIATVVYGSSGNSEQRCAWDPCTNPLTCPGRAIATHLDQATGSCTGTNGPFPPIGGIIYRHRLTIPVPSSPQLLRIKALYGEVPNSFAVEGVGAAIPTQGYTIRSTGTSGEVRRAVQITRTTPALSEMFDYVLFEGEREE